MRSISHWGMFESFDKEVRATFNPVGWITPAEWAATANCINDQKFNELYGREVNQSVANAIYQTNNFGKLD